VHNGKLLYTPIDPLAFGPVTLLHHNARILFFNPPSFARRRATAHRRSTVLLRNPHSLPSSFSYPAARTKAHSSAHVAASNLLVVSLLSTIFLRFHLCIVSVVLHISSSIVPAPIHPIYLPLPSPKFFLLFFASCSCSASATTTMCLMRCRFALFIEILEKSLAFDPFLVLNECNILVAVHVIDGT